MSDPGIRIRHILPVDTYYLVDTDPTVISIKLEILKREIYQQL